MAIHVAETHLFQSPMANIMTDNQSAIALSRNPAFHKRTKHPNVKFDYVPASSSEYWRG
jgi:hypothetical protein